MPLNTSLYQLFAIIIVICGSLYGCGGADKPLPSYEVMDKFIGGFPDNHKVIFRVVTSGDITEETLTNLCWHLFDEAERTPDPDFRPGKTKSFFIYIFPTLAHYKSESLFVATMTLTPGDDKPSPYINTGMIAALKAEPEMRLGLEEAKRKQIFWEYCTLHDETFQIAREQIPADSFELSQEEYIRRLGQQSDLTDRLIFKARLKVAQDHKITADMVKDIYEEGHDKYWPFVAP